MVLIVPVNKFSIKDLTNLIESTTLNSEIIPVWNSVEDKDIEDFYCSYPSIKLVEDLIVERKPLPTLMNLGLRHVSSDCQIKLDQLTINITKRHLDEVGYFDDWLKYACYLKDYKARCLLKNLEFDYDVEDKIETEYQIFSRQMFYIKYSIPSIRYADSLDWIKENHKWEEKMYLGEFNA